MQCFAAQAGDVAPVDGKFIDSDNQRVEVHAGAVADKSGQFCISAEVAALLQRTSRTTGPGSNMDGTNKDKKGKKDRLKDGVMSESKIADLFSLQQLGPFPLVARPDVTLVKEKTTKKMVSCGSGIDGQHGIYIASQRGWPGLLARSM